MLRIASIALLALVTACGGNKPAQTTDAAPATETAIAAESAPAEQPESAPETAPEDILPNDGTRKVGDVTKCIVSGDVFTVAADTPNSEHDGGVYYFCCPGCVKAFAKDPAKFLADRDGEATHEHQHDHEH